MNVLGKQNSMPPSQKRDLPEGGFSEPPISSTRLVVVDANQSPVAEVGCSEQQPLVGLENRPEGGFSEQPFRVMVDKCNKHQPLIGPENQVRPKRRSMPPIEELIERQKGTTIEEQLIRIRNVKLAPTTTKLAPSKPTPWERTRQLYKYASIALDHYRNEMNTEFELVEVLECFCFRVRGRYWFHVSFKAKLVDAHCIDPSPKLFFAEVNRDLRIPGSFFVTCCRILDPNTDKVSGFCGHCRRNRILHPADGMQADIMRLPPPQRSIVSSVDEMQDTKKGSGTRSSSRSCLQMENPIPPSRVESEEAGSSEKESPKQRSTILDIEAGVKMAVERAAIALDHYKKEKDVGFEVVDVKFGTFSFVVRGHYWYHFNFKAKPKDAASNDPSPKLFFAEMFREDQEYCVACCRILDPATDKVIDDCGHCPLELIVHPGDGMQVHIDSLRRRGHRPRRRTTQYARKFWEEAKHYQVVR